MDSSEVGRNRREALEREVARLGAKHKKLGTLRLAAVGVSLPLLWLVESSSPEFTVPAIALVAIAFVGSSVWFQRLEAERERSRCASLLYPTADGKREKGSLPHQKVSDTVWPEDHPYALDVDLPGEDGLLDLMSIATTRLGMAELVLSLSKPVDDADEVLARQAAVRELAPKRTLREDLFVEGSLRTSYVRTDLMTEWFGLEAVAIPRGLQAACGILSCLVIPLGLVAFVTPSPVIWFLSGVLLAQFSLWRWKVNRVGIFVPEAESLHRDFEALRGMVAILERREFQSQRLQDLVADLRTDEEAASLRIKRFCQLMRLLEARRNQFVAILGPLVMYESQTALAVERWRQENAAEFDKWIRVVGRFEAYSSLANFAFEHSDYCFPKMETERLVMRAEALGHPLIAKGAVVNDIALDEDNPVLIVSGANMAGKSTLLRSVGVNMALMYAGAPVRAKSMVVSPIQFMASIRTNDSLQHGESRFSTELKRIRIMLDYVRSGGQLLVLIDELFGGTNSYDRFAGAKALTEFLLDCKLALAILSTHDRQITHWADERSFGVRNAHFLDVFEDGSMTFDYRLREGPAQRGNATRLMLEAGIPIPGAATRTPA